MKRKMLFFGLALGLMTVGCSKDEDTTTPTPTPTPATKTELISNEWNIISLDVTPDDVIVGDFNNDGMPDTVRLDNLVLPSGCTSDNTWTFKADGTFSAVDANTQCDTNPANDEIYGGTWTLDQAEANIVLTFSVGFNGTITTPIIELSTTKFMFDLTGVAFQGSLDPNTPRVIKVTLERAN